MSIKQLDPKALSSAHFLKWHKDSLRLFWRAGPLVWMLGVMLPILVLCATFNWRQTPTGLDALWFPLMFLFGHLFIHVQIAILRQARTAGKVSFQQSFRKLTLEKQNTLYWLLPRVLMGSLVTTGIWLVVIHSVGISPQHVEGVITLLMLMKITSLSWFIQVYGCTDMTYFLLVEARVDNEASHKLQELNYERNFYLMTITSYSIMLLHGAGFLLAAAWKPAMILLPWMGWHTAGVILNAWHDIFDDDGGLAVVERSKVGNTVVATTTNTV